MSPRPAGGLGSRLLEVYVKYKAKFTRNDVALEIRIFLADDLDEAIMMAESIAKDSQLEVDSIWQVLD